MIWIYIYIYGYLVLPLISAFGHKSLMHAGKNGYKKERKRKQQHGMLVLVVLLFLQVQVRRLIYFILLCLFKLVLSELRYQSCQPALIIIFLKLVRWHKMKDNPTFPKVCLKFRVLFNLQEGSEHVLTGLGQKSQISHSFKEWKKMKAFFSFGGVKGKPSKSFKVDF